MPWMRPAYKVCPGDRIEVEVVQPDGGRALVVGMHDAVPETPRTAGVEDPVCDVRITPLQAE